MVRLLAILAAALVIPFAAGNAFGQAAYVHEMSGSVTATVGSATRALKTGDLISSGTIVSTGERSRAVIKFEDGQIMALSENSSFRIVEYRYVKERVRDSNAVFALLQGGLRFISGVIGSTNRNAFRLTAGTATIGIRGTDVVVRYDPKTQSLVAWVRDGEAVIQLSPQVPAESFGPNQTLGTIDPVSQDVLTRLAALTLPVNLPVSLTASADAVRLAEEAARLAAEADKDPSKRPEADKAAEAAQNALTAAIAAALKAVEEAVQGGAALPVTESRDSVPSGTGGTGGGGGRCGPKSVSPC